MKKTVFLLLSILILSLSACSLSPSVQGGNGNGGQNQEDILNHEHGDGNGDRFCDICNVELYVLIDFYAINDLHGKLFDGTNHPGTDELTTYLSAMRETDDEVIVLSSGDMWQGSSEAILSGGKIITDWLDAIGCVSMTLGNHEFDRGDGVIKENLVVSDFPFLAINVYDRATGKRADYCEPSVLLEFDGYEVGIIGAVGDCYSSIASEQVQNIYFKSGSELTRLVKAESERLRAMGADVIIYSLHDGYGRSTNGYISSHNLASYYDVSLSNGYVDLVFEGHSHQRYALEDQYGVYHLQGGGDNDGISHAELRLDLLTGEVSTTEANVIRSSTYSRLEADPVIEELKTIYFDDISKGFELLGSNSYRRYSDELCAKVAELYAEFGEEHWSEYEIVLGGGFLSARSPYDIYSGEVYYKHLLEIFPFDNNLTLCKTDGATLTNRFINNSYGNYWVSLTDYGASVEAFDPDGIYYLVVDSYTASYRPNNLTVVDVYDEPVYARDLLAEFIRNGGFE